MELKKTITLGSVDLEIQAELNRIEDICLISVIAWEKHLAIDITEVLKATPGMQDLLEDLDWEEEIYSERLAKTERGDHE